jgi:hypothetical protein
VTTFNIEGAHTFEMTDTKDGICCQYGANEFQITLNGKSGAISNSGDLGDFVQKSFDTVGVALLAPPSTTGWTTVLWTPGREELIAVESDNRCC